MLLYNINLFSQELNGTWVSDLADESDISVKFENNSNGTYLLYITYKGNVISYKESKREQEKLNNKIEHIILFDYLRGKATDYFKAGVEIEFLSYGIKDVPYDDEIIIRSRDYTYRYEPWKIYPRKNNNNNRNTYSNSSNSTSYNNASTNSQSSRTYQPPKETQVPNINATFASQGGFDIYKFTSYGTFTYRHFYYVQKFTSYGSRSVERESIENGTYKIMENSYGRKSVYLRFENGRQKKGVLKYKSNSVEFHIDSKVHREQ